MIKYDFSVFSLGCKVNSYEGAAMVSKLSANGFTACDGLVLADNYIINTCSVTAEADKKSRQMIARVLKINKNAKIYVCGCSSQNDAFKFENKENVKIIGGTGGKMELVDSIMSDIIGNSQEKLRIFELPETYEDTLKPEKTKTRGFVKVQDGCDNFCSYCIIPHLRGRSRSRQIDSIIIEATDAAKTSKEIVFAGINLSAYGKDIGTDLINLIKRLGEIPVRKRLGSLECQVICEDLVKAMQDNGFCNHFHLSLQSGSNAVLRRMNRRYTAEEFISKTEIIRKFCPDAGITTDIICGFPGETAEEFEETVKLFETVHFSDAHIFPYSERKGTKAYEMKQVEKSVRFDRAERLIKIKDEYKKMFLSARIGKCEDVYFEETDEDGLSCGYTGNYIKVYGKFPVGQIVNVKIKELYKEGVKGE